MLLPLFVDLLLLAGCCHHCELFV